MQPRGLLGVSCVWLFINTEQDSSESTKAARDRLPKVYPEVYERNIYETFRRLWDTAYGGYLDRR